MLVLGKQIRLATNEIKRLKVLTGVAPGQFETVESYNKFLDIQIARFDGKGAEDQALRFILARQKVKP